MSDAAMSEWFAMREMAQRLVARGFEPAEIAESMHGWVDDAISFVRRQQAESETVVPAEMVKGRWAGRFYEQPCTGCGAMLASREPLSSHEARCSSCAVSAQAASR